MSVSLSVRLSAWYAV